MTENELEKFIGEISDIDKKISSYTIEVNDILSKIGNLTGNSIEIFTESAKTGFQFLSGSMNIVGQINKGIDGVVKDEDTATKWKDKSTKIVGGIGLVLSAGSLIAGAVSSISNYIDERKRRKEYLKEVALIKQKIKEVAKEKIVSVQEYKADINNLNPKTKEALKDLCSQVQPISNSNRRTLVQANIKKVEDFYLKISILYIQLHKTESLLKAILTDKSDDLNIPSIGEFKENVYQGILDTFYEFSEPDKYINDNSCYYINGISEGTLFALSIEQYTSSHKKWGNILNKLKIIYSKEAFRTHSIFRHSDEDKKRIAYNNIYLKDIPNVDSVYKQIIKEKRKRTLYFSLILLSITSIFGLILIKKYQKTPQKSISIEKNINNNISLIQNNQAKTKENNPVGQISILRNGQKLTKVGNIFELVKPWYQAIVKNGNNTYKLKFIQGTKYSQKDKMLETAEAYPAYISVLIWKQNRNNQWQLIDKSLNFMKSGQAGEAFPISPHCLVLNGDYSNIFDENITFIFIPNIGWNQGYTTKDYTILTFDGN